MRYWVVDCITGVKSGKGYGDIDKAKARRDKLNAEEIAKGHSGEFWIVVDSEGKEVVE